MKPLAHLIATPEDLKALGWKELDVILVTADACVDHPSFPASLLARVLESEGFRVGIIARPDWKDRNAVTVLGKPRLFFGVTSGAMDSMVANYTATGRRRSDDAYAPGGKAGGRPDRAVTVYCSLIRAAFGKSVLVVAGGMEASLRRLAHYDFWSNRVRRPLLLDIGADILVHGMGERPVVQIARIADARSEVGPPGRSSSRESLLEELSVVPGVVWSAPASHTPSGDVLELPSAERVSESPEEHARAFVLGERGRQRLTQTAGGRRVIIEPAEFPGPDELDRFYGLPFSRNPHPMYGSEAIPALEQVRFGVTSHRGCSGGCSFCAITAHQGKRVISRSRESLLRERDAIAGHRQFRGTITDVGGPSANLWRALCAGPEDCKRASCLHPRRCPHLRLDQRAYAQLLSDMANHPKVKHLFVTTGVRMDVALEDPAFISVLADRFTSGHLKVAPEHLDPSVLQLMRKPGPDVFWRFQDQYLAACRRHGRERYVLPYLMAAHPGSTLETMVELAMELKKRRIRVEQCQIFTPTPGSRSTVMYATGLIPETLRPVFVERDPHRKQLQKALILYHLKTSRPAIREALRLAHRQDAEAFLL